MAAQSRVPKVRKRGGSVPYTVARKAPWKEEEGVLLRRLLRTARPRAPYLESDLQWGKSAPTGDSFVCAVFSPLSSR